MFATSQVFSATRSQQWCEVRLLGPAVRLAMRMNGEKPRVCSTKAMWRIAFREAPYGWPTPDGVLRSARVGAAGPSAVVGRGRRMDLECVEERAHHWSQQKEEGSGHNVASAPSRARRAYQASHPRRGPSAGAPGADLEMRDVRFGVDAAGLDEPLADGFGDVAAGGVDAAGDVSGVEASGGG